MCKDEELVEQLDLEVPPKVVYKFIIVKSLLVPNFILTLLVVYMRVSIWFISCINDGPYNIFTVKWVNDMPQHDVSDLVLFLAFLHIASILILAPNILKSVWNRLVTSFFYVRKIRFSEAYMCIMFIAIISQISKFL